MTEIIRTVNKGDSVYDARDPTYAGVVDGTGRIVWVDTEFEGEDDDGNAIKRCEYVPYRVWQLEWSDERGGWVIDSQGVSAHELAMER